MSKAIQFKNSSNEKIYPCPYFPVGYIYLSTVNINPNTMFGGNWRRIEDRFLLTAGQSYSAGSTGGEKEHRLTINELPSHNHSANSSYSGANFYIRHGGTANIDSVKEGTNTWIDKSIGDKWNNGFSVKNYQHNIDRVNIGGTISTGVNYTGGNGVHNNMPPYLVVYAWERIS